SPSPPSAKLLTQPPLHLPFKAGMNPRTRYPPPRTRYCPTPAAPRVRPFIAASPQPPQRQAPHPATAPPPPHRAPGSPHSRPHPRSARPARRGRPPLPRDPPPRPPPRPTPTPLGAPTLIAAFAQPSQREAPHPATAPPSLQSGDESPHSKSPPTLYIHPPHP